MQQRTGGGHGHTVGRLAQGVDQADAGGVVVAPDVAAVDHAGEQRGACGDAMLVHRGEVLVASLHQVEAHAIEFEQLHRLIDIGDIAEIRVEQDLHTVFAGRQDARVQGLEQAHVRVALVHDEIRFVQLQPLGAQIGEPAHDLRVDAGDRVDEAFVDVQFLRLAVAGELEERVRADQHGLGLIAQRLRFLILVEGLAAVEPDLGGVVELRHEVMVVRGEPLLHRQGGHVAALPLIAARHREQRLLRLLERQAAVPCGDHVEQDRRVEHLVVEAEIVARQQVDAGRLFELPMLGAQFTAHATHVVEGRVALPIRFDDLLEFTVPAHAREPGNRRQYAHDASNRGWFQLQRALRYQTNRHRTCEILQEAIVVIETSS